MECIIIDKRIDYDGSQISSLWAYNLADVQADSIIGFRGACDVRIEHMIDLEDKKQGDIIFSTDMLHFVIEHFDSTDLKLVYARQRLFTSLVREVLSLRYSDITRNGDDLFIGEKKLTISIASTSAVSQKIHFGINVFHDYYGSLEDLGIHGDAVAVVLQEIAEAYVREFDDIEKDLRKSRPLDVI
ncbi:hypothetical protein Mpsy_2618 [Methanolobus psychrophilus R15]|nr:hypothetical protein Mpsy_2618 [Methanolobus psychrophilus R15]